MFIDKLYERYLSLIFILIFLFPLFPKLMGSSQIHINILIFVLSLPVLVLGFGKKNNKIKSLIILYYFICQLLLIPSLINDIIYGSVSYSVIASFFRPVLMSITFLSLCKIIERCNYDIISRLLKITTIISFIYSIMEVFFRNQFHFIIFNLFKRETRENLYNISTTFFGTSYYSGFIFFSFFIFFIALSESKKNINNVLFCFMSLFLVLMAQSKILIFSSFLAIILYGFISRSKLIRFSSFFFLFSLCTIFYYIEGILQYLSSFDLIIFRSLNTLFLHTSQSSTLNLRLEQISYAIDLVSSHFLFGVGMGQDEMLESWISLFLYRYGALGIPLFFYLVIILCKYSKVLIKSGMYYSVAGKSILIWALLLPVTQLSSPMLETSKMAFLTNFIFAILAVLYGRVVNEKN